MFDENFAEILFNLASEDRLTLLSSVNKEKLRLSNLTRIINASPQECSRHLTRLSDSGLIRKGSDGLFETTSLGKAILAIFPSIRFLLRHRDFFLLHDLSFLPQGYLPRIGELSSGKFDDHFNFVLDQIKKVMSSGKEFVWLLSDQPIVVGPAIGASFSSKEVPVKFIGSKSIDRSLFVRTRSALPKSEFGVLPEVKVAMAINESYAGVCFPTIAGKIDFSAGFSGSDPGFRKWCSDLFECYWGKSMKI